MGTTNNRMFVAKRLFSLGSASAGIGVALGAFGAHGLKSMISAETLSVFETAVRYQMYHALGMIVTAWASTHWGIERRGFKAAGWCFVLGTILFSGSLYILCLTGERWLGAITPAGGVLFIAGWFLLFFSTLERG